MRVAISGGTSYAGACIAEAFARRGHETVALCRAVLASYTGLRRLRLERIRTAGAELHGELRAETGDMARWIAAQRLDVWIHHHHPMEDFRAPGYDVARGRAVALAPLDGIVEALNRAGVRALLLSGTYFEPGEGGRPADAPSTPYATLKAALSDALRARAVDAGLSFGKVVISAPTGALENEDRLTPQLILAAARQAPYVLRAPSSVMDVIPGEALAELYVDAALERLDAGRGEPRVYRPSGWVVSAGEWTSTARATILRALGLEGALHLEVPEPHRRSPPVTFQNPQNERVSIDWDACFERYAREWKESQPFR